MMRQITLLTVTLLLSVCLLASCGNGEVPSGASTACTHQWTPATCLAPKTCTQCGVTEGEIGAHHHKSVDYLPATCTAEGKQVYECTVCSDRYTKAVAASGHIPIDGICAVCGTTVVGDVKNVILVIGDGMGIDHLTAYELATGDHLPFRNWSFVTVHTAPDCAASATAMATGKQTENGTIAVDADGARLATVLDYAKESGKRTGIVTTDSLHGATPAAFSAHGTDATDRQAILASQLASGIDLLYGAADEIALNADRIAEYGYTLCTDLTQADKTAAKIYCTVDPSFASLSEATEFALEYLNNEQGFVLVIEQAQIDPHSRANDLKNTLAAVEALNQTVQSLVNWIGTRNDTAILVTSDHASGGLAVSATEELASYYTEGCGVPFYYQFGATEPTDEKVGLFLYGTYFDYSTLPYYQSPVQIKNSDIYTIIKTILDRS